MENIQTLRGGRLRVVSRPFEGKGFSEALPATLLLLCCVVALVALCVSPACADNAFLSRPRVLVDGEWKTFTSGAFDPAAVTKTAFDITISYHDTLSADSIPPGDPKRTRAQEVEEVIKFWSDALYEQSNGQHMLGTVYIYQGGSFADKASVVWQADTWPTGAIAGYGKPGQHINFGDVFGSNTFVGVASTPTSRADGGYTLGHESGHYLYGLYDEYVATYANPPRSWPWSSDVSPAGPSLMNRQWNAMSENEVKWLNHSTANIYVASTDTAQKRMYGKSCWEVLLQDPSSDGVSGDVVAPGRVQYAFANPPASPDWYTTAVTPGTHLAAAQANLKIVWLTKAAMVYQIVIDNSGSMGSDPFTPEAPSPLDYAKAAARNLVESLPKESAVGVVRFDDTVEQIYAITFIPSDDVGARAVKDAAKAAISGLAPGNMTAIYDAASTALANFLTYKGTASGDVLGVTYLLTDGEDNSSKKSMGEAIAEHQAAKVPLITVGYGSGGSGNSALTQLADETGGQYFASPTNQTELQEVFFAALGNYSDTVNLGAVEKTLAAGGNDVATFLVDGTLGGVTFFVSWRGASSDAEITLRDPVLGDVTASGEYQEEGGIVDYTAAISNPSAGTWRVELHNPGSQSLAVSVSATGQPETGTGFGLVVGLADGGSTVTPPDPIRLLARASRNGIPLRGVTMEATLTAPDGTTSPLTLRDDGTGGDATANDGFFSAILTSYQEGSYKINVTASNPSGAAVETYRNGSPSIPGPGDEALVFSPDGATVATNFLRTTSFQVKAEGGVIPSGTPTPTEGPTPTASPTPGGGGGGGGGCSAGSGFHLAPLLLLLLPGLFLRRR